MRKNITGPRQYACTLDMGSLGEHLALFGRDSDKGIRRQNIAQCVILVIRSPTGDCFRHAAVRVVSHGYENIFSAGD